MKKISLLLFLSVVIYSCSSSSTAPKLKESNLKGTWEITDVKFIGNQGTYKAFLFDVADSSCFNGSEWVFISNNNTGKFTTAASNSECAVVENQIQWSIFENAFFQFKYTNFDKARKVTTGYRAAISTFNENQMVVNVKSTSNGQPFDVVLTFNKKSDNINL